MKLLNDVKEEYRENVYNAIDSGGSKGISLREICAEVFDEKDSDEYIQTNKSHVFNALDELLEEEAISFDDEQDLWKCIGV